MAISSLNFIISQFQSEKYRYYAIYDEDNDRVYLQNDLIDFENALGKLKSFFKENEGYFTIYVLKQKWSQKTNLKFRDDNTIVKYNVEVTTPALPMGVNGLSGMNNSSLPSDDPRSNAPNMFQLLGAMSQVEQNMKLMEKDHAHYREMKELQDENAKLKEEGGKSKGMGAIVDRLGEHFSDPNVLVGLLSGVSQLFKKEAVAPMHGINRDDIMPMNGIDEEVINNISTRRDKMVGAVNLLMQHDANFPENISKLATLAKNKPAIYSMAVSYLNNL